MNIHIGDQLAVTVDTTPLPFPPVTFHKGGSAITWNFAKRELRELAGVFLQLANRDTHPDPEKPPHPYVLHLAGSSGFISETDRLALKHLGGPYVVQIPRGRKFKKVPWTRLGKNPNCRSALGRHSRNIPAAVTKLRKLRQEQVLLRRFLREETQA